MLAIERQSEEEWREGGRDEGRDAENLTDRESANLWIMLACLAYSQHTSARIHTHHNTHTHTPTHTQGPTGNAASPVLRRFQGAIKAL